MTGCDLCGVGPDDDCTMECPSRYDMMKPLWDEVFSTGRVIANIEPGNSTQYRVMIVAPSEPLSLDGRRSPEGDFIVSVLSPVKTVYPWNPSYVTDEYVAERWTEGRMPDAIIVAEFLRSMSTSYWTRKA